jgi:hypothetical protein
MRLGALTLTYYPRMRIDTWRAAQEVDDSQEAVLSIFDRVRTIVTQGTVAQLYRPTAALVPC